MGRGVESHLSQRRSVTRQRRTAVTGAVWPGGSSDLPHQFRWDEPLEDGGTCARSDDTFAEHSYAPTQVGSESPPWDVPVTPSRSNRCTVTTGQPVDTPRLTGLISRRSVQIRYVALQTRAVLLSALVDVAVGQNAPHGSPRRRRSLGRGAGNLKTKVVGA